MTKKGFWNTTAVIVIIAVVGCGCYFWPTVQSWFNHDNKDVTSGYVQEINTLQTMIDANNSTIFDLRSQVVTYQDEIAVKQAEKNNALESDVEALNNQIVGLQAKVDSLETRIAGLEAENQEHLNRIGELQTQILSISNLVNNRQVAMKDFFYGYSLDKYNNVRFSDGSNHFSYRTETGRVLIIGSIFGCVSAGNWYLRFRDLNHHAEGEHKQLFTANNTSNQMIPFVYYLEVPRGECDFVFFVYHNVPGQSISVNEASASHVVIMDI